MRQKKLWMLAAILIISGSTILTSCSNDDDPITPPTDEVEAQLQKMTLREKVGQLFYVRPECLDTTIHFNLPSSIDASSDDIKAIKLQAVNATMLGVNEKYPVGGIILYAHNIEDEAQLSAFVSQIRALNGSPLLCIDEEGGRVARIANNENFEVEKFESMGAIGATGDAQNAYYCANTIGTYLHRYGFDIDFAPVADVNTNPENIIIGARAFSDDPQVAAPMVVNYLQGLKDAGITGCIKHFPGHGDTKADTHYGYAQSLKTWDEMQNCEMITFKAGIQWGTQLIMTAHIAAPNVTGSDIPATMSHVILQDKLRGELGYQNIIITDGIEMGAITQQYSSADAAVGTLQAGADIVLGPQNFVEAFDAVVKAVEDGRLTEQRIDQSVRRVLNPSDSGKKEVRIAIAWRADTDNEFCTNIVEAFREAGVTVTVLPQIKARYLDYDGSAVSMTCIDADGIGYLSNASGTLVRSLGYAESNAAEVLKGVDGVVFTGGEDIAPSLYATQADWHHIEAEIDYNAARDVSDFLTMTYCLDHDIPIFGFCRGAQMLGVVSGATVVQDIPTWFVAQGLPYNYEHRREKAEGETYRDYTPHDVTLTDGSLLSRYFGTTTLTGCPSWHHQAILKHIGKGVNNANASQFMTYDAALPLFRAFIDECKKK